MPKAADEFKESLLDGDQSADQAKDLLLRMRSLAPDPKQKQVQTVAGRLGRSKFPTAIYNDLTEIINAKRLWQAGDKRLHPWPFNAAAKKPNYVVGEEPVAAGKDEKADGFYSRIHAVGDHIKVTGVQDMDDLVRKFGSRLI